MFLITEVHVQLLRGCSGNLASKISIFFLHYAFENAYVKDLFEFVKLAMS